MACKDSYVQANVQFNYFGLIIQIRYSKWIDPIQTQLQSNYFWKKTWDNKYKMAKFYNKTIVFPSYISYKFTT